jgi:hypothetical protein
MADPSAIMTLRNARALSRDSIHRRILAAEETVLLVKFGVPDDMRHLRRARAVADSLLRSVETASTSELGGLAVAAAVTGRIQLAADLLRREERNETIEQDLPLALREAGAALLAYAAFGAPADSIAAYESVIDDLVRNRLPRDSQLQRRARHELLDQAAGLVFPHHPLRQSEDLARDTGHRLLQAQAALAAGNTTSARTTLHEMLRSRADARPGTSPATMPFDALYPEARLHLAIGDTVQAIVAMDSSLAALRWGEPDALAHVESMAALIHTMALRALVAAAHGDRAAARRWAAPVISLWGGADPQLEPVTSSMRPLSRD